MRPVGEAVTDDDPRQRFTSPAGIREGLLVLHMFETDDEARDRMAALLACLSEYGPAPRLSDA